MQIKSLAELKKREVGTVLSIEATPEMLRRYTDIGCIKGCKIQMLQESAMGGPHAFLICGAVIAIRKEDAANIRVRIDHYEKD